MNAVDLGLAERREDSRPAPATLIAKAEQAIRDYPGCFWFRHPDAKVTTLDDVRIAVLHLREYGGWKEWGIAQELQKCLSPLFNKKS